MAWYLDTSALVKLVVAEDGTEALREWLALADREPVCCDLARTELLRAVRRVVPDRLVSARAVLGAVTLLAVTADVFDRAALLEPSGMRSLDAVHLASALSLGDDLDGLVTYDDRLADAATKNGVVALAPR